MTLKYDVRRNVSKLLVDFNGAVDRKHSRRLDDSQGKVKCSKIYPQLLLEAG